MGILGMEYSGNVNAFNLWKNSSGSWKVILTGFWKHWRSLVDNIHSVCLPNHTRLQRSLWRCWFNNGISWSEKCHGMRSTVGDVWKSILTWTLSTSSCVSNWSSTEKLRRQFQKVPVSRQAPCSTLAFWCWGNFQHSFYILAQKISCGKI